MASPKTVQASAKPVRSAQAMSSLVLESTAHAKAASVTVTVPSEVFEVLSPKAETVKQVAEAMSRVIKRSEISGRPGGFTFTADGQGNCQIAPLPDDSAQDDQPPETERIDRAFAGARERGRIRAAQILDQEDMLSADAFADRLGVSRVTVNARRQRHELLGLDGAKRGYRFPEWQVDEDGKAFEALPRLFELLGPSPWGVYRFFTQRHDVLNGATAKDALRQGRSQQVLDAAESLGRGDFS